MKGADSMTEQGTDPNESADDLWRWLLGGLAAGVVILGLAISAYAIGYSRGKQHARTTATPATTAPPVTAPPPTTPQGPVTVTPALVARGKALYSSATCAGCHSLDGTSGAGPSFKALAGSSVALDGGQTVTADDAYLQESIVDPDAQIVEGFHSGLMAPAISSYDLASKPADVRALVAFIQSQK
jgi:mono/diheme cytochrome c family protein